VSSKLGALNVVPPVSSLSNQEEKKNYALLDGLEWYDVFLLQSTSHSSPSAQREKLAAHV
jgi:hypothetical protein